MAYFCVQLATNSGNCLQMGFNGRCLFITFTKSEYIFHQRIIEWRKQLLRNTPLSQNDCANRPSWNNNNRLSLKRKHPLQLNVKSRWLRDTLVNRMVFFPNVLINPRRIHVDEISLSVSDWKTEIRNKIAHMTWPIRAQILDTTTDYTEIVVGHPETPQLVHSRVYLFIVEWHDGMRVCCDLYFVHVPYVRSHTCSLCEVSASHTLVRRWKITHTHRCRMRALSELWYI